MADAVEQAGPNCFVFRTSDDTFVQEELNQGRLRQGWSPPGTSLLDNGKNPRTKEAWTQTYKEAWGGGITTICQFGQLSLYRALDCRLLQSLRDASQIHPWSEGQF